MALVNCPECNKEISDKVKTCPHCGYPLFDDTPQKVEVTGVNIKDNSKKKILISIVTLIAISLTTYGIITAINSKKSSDYRGKINSVTYLLYTNTSRCESMCGNISRVWSNAVFDYYDSYNKGYLDFNKAINNLLNDSHIKADIKTIKETDYIIEDNIKSLQNPPADYREIYDDILELYGDYQGLVSQATNPSGSLTSYNSDVNNKTDSFMKNYNKIQAKLPKK